MDVEVLDARGLGPVGNAVTRELRLVRYARPPPEGSDLAHWLAFSLPMEGALVEGHKRFRRRKCFSNSS